MSTIEKAKDGYYHPENEAQLQQLISSAAGGPPGTQLRVRGSSHSVTASIYTDGYAGEGNPPSGIDVMLDKYRRIGPLVPVEGDPDHALVEVEGGCNLGKNPYDPTNTSTWENSLNYFLQQQGFALSDLGGISHQTVGGFLSTGSSGGSLIHSIDENIVGLRIIDGTGKIWDLRRDDPDLAQREMFFAAGVSMGLLGVLSKVTLRVERTYNLSGNQLTAAVTDIPIDLFGPGNDQQPSLERFLHETPYTRLMWWPQHGLQRMQIWQAERIAVEPGFVPEPYQELGRSPQLASLAGSLFYTIIGNLDELATVPAKLTNWYAHLDGTISRQPDVNACSGPTPETAHTAKYSVADVLEFLMHPLLDAITQRGDAVTSADHTTALLAEHGSEPSLGSDLLARLITELIEKLLNGALSSTLMQYLARWFETELPYIIHYILAAFVTDGTVNFRDTWMCGLPMDNQMDDQLWTTWFTELWLPVENTAAAMQALQTYYLGGGDPTVAYAHTGAFSCELYAAKASQFWMSPAYGRDVFRVDVFWFGLNAGSPTDSFYPPFWELLKSLGFVPHWGKFLPTQGATWTEHYRRHLPKFDDFLALRARLDPKQIFVSAYWRDHLGIAATAV